jgi:DNA-binding MarR family transcriptional regulator
MQLSVKTELSALELSAWRGFLRVHAAVLRELDRELQDAHDLPLTAYEVLLFLEQAPENRLRMSELAASLLLSQSGITRLVDRLEREGLVVRERCDSDGRGYYAVLTAEGRARFAEARPTHLAGVRGHFLDRLSERDLVRLAVAWDRILPGASD